MAGTDAAAKAERDAVFARIRSGHPGFREAVLADAVIAYRYRGEGHHFSSRRQAIVQIARLSLVSDAFLAQMLYRAKARMQALGIPLLPHIAHRLSMILSQISIGDTVVIAPGVYIAHGQTVIGGLTEIGRGVVISPFTSIGLRAGSFAGPVLEDEVYVGTGAQVLGPLRIGAGARVGANSLVIRDVPAGATVAGSPARQL